jgi:superoxide dismutase
MKNEVARIADEIEFGYIVSSSKYPKDLGYWAIEMNKLDELERHLSKLTVEIRVYDIDQSEFPKIDAKTHYELHLKSDAKNSRKVEDELKRMKAFEIEEHHVTNLKEEKQKSVSSSANDDAHTVSALFELTPLAKEFKDYFTITKSKTEGPDKDNGSSSTTIQGTIKKEFIDKYYGVDTKLEKLEKTLQSSSGSGPGQAYSKTHVTLKPKGKDLISFTIYEESGLDI